MPFVLRVAVHDPEGELGAGVAMIGGQERYRYHPATALQWRDSPLS